MATFRYLVNDVEKAIEFYTKHLNFQAGERWGKAFGMVTKDDLIIWLSGPETSAARPMPDGRQPEPGGWNRAVLEVDDLPELVDKMRKDGVKFRNEIVSGPGGSQILAEDPSGNVIELFQAG